ISKQSNDTRGVVTACLVRNGNIVADGYSTDDGIHAEYALLQKLSAQNEKIQPEDIIYTTVEPCGKRTPGGRGEKMGDCTTNLIKAGAKHIIYAAQDPDSSEATRHRFSQVEVTLIQVKNKTIIDKAIRLFNSTH